MQLIKLYKLFLVGWEIAYSENCVHRALLPFYGQFNRPTEAAIRAIVTKFRTKFTLLDIKPATRLRRLQTEENIAAVSASVNHDHQFSIRRRLRQLGRLCYSTKWKWPCCYRQPRALSRHDDQFCDANYSSKAYATVLVSIRRRSTAHKSHNNRFSEEIVSGPFDVEKWWFGLATAFARFGAAWLLLVGIFEVKGLR